MPNRTFIFSLVLSSTLIILSGCDEAAKLKPWVSRVDEMAEEPKFKANVFKVETTYHTVNDNGIKKRFKGRVVQLDEAGNKLHADLYDDTGALRSTIEYVYEEGRLVAEEHTHQKSQTTVFRYSYEIGNDGNVVKMIKTRHRAPIGETNITYFADGGRREVLRRGTEIVSILTYDSNDLLVESSKNGGVQTYDEFGNVVFERYDYGDGIHQIFEHTNSYNEHYCLSSVWTNSMLRRELKYNENGDLVKETQYDQDGLLSLEIVVEYNYRN